MAELTLKCSSCGADVKLTESLAAPLIESTKRDFEQRLATKDAEIAKREFGLREREEEVQRARDSVDAEVLEKLKQERSKIASEEARKAKLVLSADLDLKTKEIRDLQQAIKERDEQLGEAQKAQAELVKKQRELDAAKRELELTVEKRVQEGYAEIREQMRKEVEERARLQVEEKEIAIAGLEERIEEFQKREVVIREREVAVQQAKEAVEQQVESRIEQERSTIAAEESRKAKLALAHDISQKTREITDLQEVLQQKDFKLAEAQNAQAELMRKQRELDDAQRAMELTIQKRIQESLSTEREQARKEVEEQHKLKLMESQHTISSMQKQIEELKRKAEQGSQQLQGEVQELELEGLLKAKFPIDGIDPVPKGEFGGDVLHRVIGPLGHACGTILWESKRTKSWSDSWLPKLRDDQRAARAEIAIIVSHTLPPGIDSFDLREGVWIAHPKAALPVAVALRQTLLEVGAARQASEGQDTKMAMVYKYLTGPRFRQRIESIVEAFTHMQEDLEKERKVILKQWAKREEQIGRVMEASVGLYGDFQGIAGKTLQEIGGLELPALLGSEISTGEAAGKPS